MVSAGEVSSISSDLSSSFSELKNSLLDLNGAWKGSSYENLISKVDNFTGEFEAAISEQISSFSDAVNAYSAYKQAKQNYNTARANYNAAVSNKDTNSMSTFQADISRYRSLMDTKKEEVNAALQQVMSVKLEASSNSSSGGSSASAGGSTSSASSNSGGGTGTSNAVSTSGLTYPLANYRVTSEFGYRGDIGVAGATSNHKGIDLGGNPTGTPIQAAQGGTVTASQWMDGYGYVVFIDHGDGMQTRYAHCSELDVTVGQTVEAGESIAKIGSTGNSSGPHLHFEVRVDGTPVNPREYFEF